MFTLKNLQEAIEVIAEGLKSHDDWDWLKVENPKTRRLLIDRWLRETQPANATPLRSLCLPQQNYICPLCENKKHGRLVDAGTKVPIPTEIDHEWKMECAVAEVMHGRMTISEAYKKVWHPANLRAVHKPCNHARG